MTRKNENDSVRAVSSVAQANTVKLNKATTALQKVVDELNSSSDIYSDLVQNIELKNAELGKLETTFEEKEREMKADLVLRAKENERVLVSEVLNKQGKVSIDSSELISLQEELAEIKASFADKVKSEVGKAVGMANSKHQSELREKDLGFEARTASMQAALENAAEKIDVLNNQVTDYKTQIAEDRHARVQEAQARGGQTIHLTNEKK